MKSLAAVFIEVVKTDGEAQKTRADLDKVAARVSSKILVIIKEEDIQDIGHWNEVVADAYATNGWSQSAGRPKPGSTETPAPKVVKQYVSTVRSGYRLGLDVPGFTTMNQLKEAIAAEQRPHGSRVVSTLPELQGVHLVSENRLIGSFFHDLPTLWQRLPEDKQALYLKRLERVYAEMLKSAPPDLKLVA